MGVLSSLSLWFSIIMMIMVCYISHGMLLLVIISFTKGVGWKGIRGRLRFPICSWY